MFHFPGVQFGTFGTRITHRNSHLPLKINGTCALNANTGKEQNAKYSSPLYPRYRIQNEWAHEAVTALTPAPPRLTYKMGLTPPSPHEELAAGRNPPLFMNSLETMFRVFSVPEESQHSVWGSEDVYEVT